MRIKRQSFIICIILCIILFSLFIGIFIILSKHTFLVKDESQKYTITYSSSELLNNYLDKWHVWEKNSMTLNASVPKTTIRTIRLHLIDRNDARTPFKITYNGGDFFDTTYGGTIDRNGRFDIYIYLDPRSVPNGDQELLTLTALHSFLNILYTASHVETFNTKESKDTIINALQDFKKKQQYPFTVSQP